MGMDLCKQITVANEDQPSDSHVTILRLFANIDVVNKLTKLESNRGRHSASSSFLNVVDLGHKLYGFIAYLSFSALTKGLNCLKLYWDSFGDGLLMNTAIVW